MAIKTGQCAKGSVRRSARFGTRAVRRSGEGRKARGDGEVGRAEAPATRNRKTVWVVSRLAEPYDGGRRQLSNRVFSSFRKACDFVRREFENGGRGEDFDCKYLVDHLFISNGKCEYVLEECEVS